MKRYASLLPLALLLILVAKLLANKLRPKY